MQSDCLFLAGLAIEINDLDMNGFMVMAHALFSKSIPILLKVFRKKLFSRPKQFRDAL